VPSVAAPRPLQWLSLEVVALVQVLVQVLV
jgi:hypothetical protein